ncbi:Uncharacterised protein [Shigella sonnei]|nr:Uncharacterised protein [Shigella sonnei]
MHLCKPADGARYFLPLPPTSGDARNQTESHQFFANGWPESALTLHPYLRAPLYRVGF